MTEQDNVFTKVGPFSPIFQSQAGGVPPYLSLLHLHRESATSVVGHIQNIVEAHDYQPVVVSLLCSKNWRPHLVGIIAAYLGARSSSVTAQMWRAFDGGSWVAPQIAAVLSLIDPGFRDRAVDRLRNRCPVITDAHDEMASALEQHVARGPGDESARSRKAASVLLAILRLDASGDASVHQLENNPDLQRFLTEDPDDGGDIAVQWRTRFLQIVEATRESEPTDQA